MDVLPNNFLIDHLSKIFLKDGILVELKGKTFSSSSFVQFLAHA